MKDVNLIIDELLQLRGIDDKDEFLSSRPVRTYDPFLMLNMDVAVDRIVEAIDKKEKICIYGDYDADGITSVTMMMQTLMKLTDNVYYYIPSRFNEGYGLNMDAIDVLKSNDTDLVITVDCGSVSCAEVEYVKSLGMDIIVSDHHNIDESQADCILLNPKQAECEYPFENLAGCGVAFKIIQALQRRLNLDRSCLNDVLDLVAIGTIGDIVPLLDENRTITKYGIRAVRATGREGLDKLISGAGLHKESITSENIAFCIVPHLNAAGRIKDASLAVEVLLGRDSEKIDKGVAELIECNKKRKKYQEDAYLECVDIVEQHLMDRNFIVIRCNDAHEGITGIVAGKLKDRYNKPVAIVTPTEDGLKGTVRSIEKINVYDVLKTQKELFSKFGGHAGACGFVIPQDSLQQFKKGINTCVGDMARENPDIMKREIKKEYALEPEEVSADLINQIKLLEPFGHCNEKPAFFFEDVEISDVSRMGTEGKHLRFNIVGSKNTKIKCVLFNEADKYIDKLNSGRANLVIGTLDFNIWKDKKNIQCQVCHVQ